MKNLLQHIPDDIPNELFETILQSKHVKIERIISKGHVTTSMSWYDQDFDEWVLILEGAAKIRIKDSTPPISLIKGDSLLIPAHQKHQVAWTPKDQTTIWLAIHIYKGKS